VVFADPAAEATAGSVDPSELSRAATVSSVAIRELGACVDWPLGTVTVVVVVLPVLPVEEERLNTASRVFVVVVAGNPGLSIWGATLPSVIPRLGGPVVEKLNARDRLVWNPAESLPDRSSSPCVWKDGVAPGLYVDRASV